MSQSPDLPHKRVRLNDPPMPIPLFTWNGRLLDSIPPIAYYLDFFEDPSFLLFARTCRGTHNLMMFDPVCWTTQCMVLELRRPLLHRYDLIPTGRPFSTQVVRAEQLNERNREILRRLISPSVYDEVVAPKLAITQTITPFSRPDDDDEDASDDTPECQVNWQNPVAVYPHLTRDVLQEEIPCFMFDHKSHPRETAGWSWMYGCYDSLLLPTCVNLLPRAYVTIKLIPETLVEYQTDCLYRLLERLPSLTSLNLIMPKAIYEGASFPVPDWALLFPILPKLRHLSTEKFNSEWRYTFKPILQNQTSLIKLEIDGTMMWADGEFCQRFYFKFTPKRRVSSHGNNWLALNAALRIELCDYLLEYWQGLIGVTAGAEDLQPDIDECEAVKLSLASLKDSSANVKDYKLRCGF